MFWVGGQSLPTKGHISDAQVDPGGQAGGPQSHAGGPDVNPELELQRLAPPLGGSSGPLATSGRGCGGVSVVTVVHRFGEDSGPGSGVPREGQESHTGWRK